MYDWKQRGTVHIECVCHVPICACTVGIEYMHIKARDISIGIEQVLIKNIMSYFERLSVGEEVVKGEVRGVVLLHG